MTVTVRYFAAAAAAAGCAEEELDVPLGTLGAVRGALLDRYGDAMSRVLGVCSFLVDGVVTRDLERPVGPRVDVLPPFAGG